VEDGGHVVSTVASVLAVKERPPESLSDSLTDSFQARRVLLVFDDCEHLLEACGDLAELLLHRCPDLRVLATSRERLHVDGEAVFAVPPLPVPARGTAASPTSLMDSEAVRLFADRAAAARPGFRLTEDNAEHVVRACTELDGLPLAIELAAARLSVLSARELAERLAKPLDMLKDGPRAMRPQHVALRATLEWSHELLGPEAQALFRRLSVFRGGWTLGAAEAVCPGDWIRSGDVLDLMQQLADSSLVNVTRGARESRYGLRRLLREYAAEKLAESGETADTQARHLGHFLELAERAESDMRGPCQVECLRRLELEHANTRAALGHARHTGDAERGMRLVAALERFWIVSGRQSEGRAAALGMLALEGSSTRTAVRARALATAGRMAEGACDYDAARALHEESLAIFRELVDEDGIARSLANLGAVAEMQADLAEWRRLCETSLAISREVDSKGGIAKSLEHLGTLAEYQGDYDAARRLLGDSLVAYGDLGDKRGIARSVGRIGRLAMLQGDYGAARRLLEESLAILRELGRPCTGDVLTQLGILDAEQGNYDGARRFLKESLAIRRELGDRRGIGCALQTIADIAVVQGNAEVAARLKGAERGLRADAGYVLNPSHESKDTVTTAAARAALGDDAHRAAHAQGRALTLDEAVAYALGEVTWDELEPIVAERLAAVEADDGAV